MAPERPVRTVWIVLGLMLGFAVVLTGPALLVWDWVKPAAWSETDLKAEFQSVRYESGGLVFRYSVRNMTRHAAEFSPSLTEVHTLQAKGTQPVGYPNVLLPFDIPARSSHILEVRLELPSSRPLSSGVTFGDPLPGTPETAQPEELVQPQPSAVANLSVEDALTELDGFELVDEIKGLHLLLPRAW